MSDTGTCSALIPRPLERGPDRELNFKPDPEAFDILAKDFLDFARQLDT